MFKRLINSAMAFALTTIMASSYWDIIGFGDSLFLFGEPNYPTIINKEGN